MKPYLIVVFFMLFSTSLFCQLDKPIWDIGTKWTYEYQPFFNLPEVRFITNEIVDTVTIDNLKLYEVESPGTGISHFYYENGKVYNYNPWNKVLQLLYDFGNVNAYSTDYEPICDPTFDAQSQDYKTYPILIDSISDFVMPDATVRTLQYVTTIDSSFRNGDTTFITPKREVLSNIGFMNGAIHYTHDWELGMHICDEFGNYVGQLRCFENDSVHYNFVGYPCDSTWIITNTKELELSKQVSIYPNPSYGTVELNNVDVNSEFEVLTQNGIRVESGRTDGKSIELKHEGINLLRIRQNDKWTTFKIVNLGVHR